MHVLALNGSPHGPEGNTWKLVEPFLAELTETGAAVETVHVRDLNVAPCLGCFACWRNDGTYVQADDMSWLLPRVGAAETLVLAAPLYVDHVPGPLKTVLDRLIPLVEPRIELVEDHCRHPRRAELQALRRVVLVAVCGFWELENFTPLVSWAQAMCRNLRCDFAGALLRPHAHAFTHMPRVAPAKGRVLKGLKAAARELVIEGRVSPATEATVAENLVGRDLFVNLANRSRHSERR